MKTYRCQLAVLAAALLATATTPAQQTIGTIPTSDAELSGTLATTGGPITTLLTQVTITAREHTATAMLARGGAVRVCMSSVGNISMPAAAAGADPAATRPLLVALDRGAIEFETTATTTDTILTPDIRMQPMTSGPLDLRVRVVENGDTCVENRGGNAPALMIADSFGESSYLLHAGQHVLFEHGSLKQVVDNESSPCGCPAAVAAATEPHPFPEAVSAGLAPAPAPTAQPVGQVHTQVGATLSYNAGQTETTATVASNAVPVQQSAEPQAPPDVATLIKRLYRFIFRRGH